MKASILIALLFLTGCASAPQPCDQPRTYYNDPDPSLWPHC